MASETMSLSQTPLTLIVAATAKNGIGKNGGLPWPMLKKDMAFFARVTKRLPTPTNTDSVQSDAFKASVLDGTRKNVVIMGRKTWDSIPPKFRPLKDRTHIVISSQRREKLEAIPDDVVVAKDISSGLESLENLVKEGKAPAVGRAFVIGGSSIYKAALELRQTRRVLLTRISKEFECDTHFPELDGGWRRAELGVLREFVGEDVEEGEVQDGEVGLEFQLWEREV